MITAFKPSKPDKPRTHCLNRTKGGKRGFPWVNDENSKRNICFYCISKTYCHLGHKDGGRCTTVAIKDLKTCSKKQQHINTAHIAAIEYYTYTACHLKPSIQYQALCEGPAVR